MANSPSKGILKKIKLNESTISTLLGALVVVVIGILVFNYFRGVGQVPQEEIGLLPEETGEEINLVQNEEGELVPESLPATHKVVGGENLWSIAKKYYGSGYNWVDIAKENNLKNPDVLLTDQELSIPKTAVIQPVVEKTEVATPAVAGSQTISDSQYTVVKGDNLWQIAVRAYGDGYQWTKIAQANNLENPSLIHQGNVLTLLR